MKEKLWNTGAHVWHFIQTGGLVQLKITSIDDILHLKELDPKLWVALACPVKGLEFSEETLSLLDTDKNGRVRVPELLAAVEYIKTYFKTPDVIMTEGSSVPLSSLSDTQSFDCGYTPLESARAVLHILGKDSADTLTLDDVTVNETLFSPSVVNGDGVVPPEAVDAECAKACIQDIICTTGGTRDISGALGTDRAQATAFFAALKENHAWRKAAAAEESTSVFFLGDATDEAAQAYMRVRHKISEYFLRCALKSYNSGYESLLQKKDEDTFSQGKEALLTEDALASLPLANAPQALQAEKTIPFGTAINPAWQKDMQAFEALVVTPLLGAGKTALTESDWKRIESTFSPYLAWYNARPKNCVSALSFERIDEILTSDAEALITAKLDEEDHHPPIALATVALRKLLLFRRDLVQLLRNFVSFEDFYSFDDWAIFQCGTLYIDGRSCTLCFRVLDGSAAKHAAMSPLSQCYLLYCDCKRPSEGRSMQIAALVSAGNRDNLITGRNGLFYDRNGQDWDCTVTKIVENPISIREAFWSPYKKLSRIIQERIAKRAVESESSINAKLTTAVEKPLDAAAQTAATCTKKFDVGTVAALGVAFSGFAAVIGTILGIITRKWWMPPVFIIGLMLIISLPSMILSWLKLRERNIAPILDASGWAVNGNVRINLALGALFTQLRKRPAHSHFNAFDPYKDKKFPFVGVLLGVLATALLAGAVVLVAKNGWSFPDTWESIKSFFSGLFAKKVASA